MAASLPSPIVSSKRSSAFFTMEDARAGFNIFCCICGIGSLSMPSNYARAGPVFATIALLFMAFANIYATIALSKTMLVAPSSVRTYSDLGRWAMGKTGYYLVMVSQLGVCLLTPCAFLVLGGQLLDVLFPDAFSQIFWIVFMAVLVLPVALIPTLKESAGAAVVGCLGTIISDVIAIAVLLYNMRGHSSVPSPDVTFHQVITSFGNLSLAYGAAIIIPDLQRQHSNPRRMPRIVLVSLGLASAFFLVLAVVGYSAGGCQISGNILFSIANTSDPTAATSLGFIADRGAVLMSFLFMQLHLSIAFSTILQPAFYTLETLLLGMHKVSVPTDDIAIECELLEKVSSHNATTPSGSSDAAFSALESNFTGNDRLSIATQQNEDESEYKGAKNVMRYVPARILLIAVQAVASILLRDHFLDIVDFTGATFITVCCLLLPLVFYLKVLWSKLPIYEKIVAPLVILICGAAGIYVMIYAGKNLFNPDSSSATFPYCDAEYQDEPYYVRNSTV